MEAELTLESTTIYNGIVSTRLSFPKNGREEDNMATNPQNLKPIDSHGPARAREIRQMGARAANEARKRNKNLKDAFRAMQDTQG